MALAPEQAPLPVDSPEPPFLHNSTGPENENFSFIKNSIVKLLKFLIRIPIIIIKGIMYIFGSRIKDYPDDTWKGGGPEGPASYNAPPPAG